MNFAITLQRVRNDETDFSRSANYPTDEQRKLHCSTKLDVGRNMRSWEFDKICLLPMEKNIKQPYRELR